MAASSETYKHFSHTHPLSLHHPASADLHCSGCNSGAAAGTAVYACWPCNFFLHDQCFRARRSLRHPSHPTHPLTLFPYPTYPSASFFCNTCGLAGNAFCYACSHCDFDVHVHCAVSAAGPNPNPNGGLGFVACHQVQTTSVYPPPPPAVQNATNVFPSSM